MEGSPRQKRVNESLFITVFPPLISVFSPDWVDRREGRDRKTEVDE